MRVAFSVTGLAGLDQTMCRSEEFDVMGVAFNILGEADGGEDLVEGVADVLEFVVEILAVMLEPVLEAF